MLIKILEFLLNWLRPKPITKYPVGKPSHEDKVLRVIRAYGKPIPRDLVTQKTQFLTLQKRLEIVRKLQNEQKIRKILIMENGRRRSRIYYEILTK